MQLVLASKHQSCICETSLKTVAACVNAVGAAPYSTAALRTHSLCAQSRSLLVLQGRADLEDRPQGWSLLHIAAGLGQAAAVRFLLAKGVDPMGKHTAQACVEQVCEDPAQHTVLWDLRCYRQLGCGRLRLISCRLCSSLLGCHCFSSRPLASCAGGGEIRCMPVHALAACCWLSAGGSARGIAPLHAAAFAGNLSCVKQLLAAGAPITQAVDGR